MTTTLAAAWNRTAARYDAYFGPRFIPWTDAAVDAVSRSLLPAGPIVVTCCGPGREVLALAGSRDVVGVDVSQAMIALTRQRCAQLASPPRLIVGDATDLAAHGIESAAAVVSCFGLQQLPDPLAAITSWTRALRPTGVLSVMFWPHDCEPDGAFGVGRRIVAEHLGETVRHDHGWEAGLTSAIERAGAQLLSDDEVRHEMCHADARSLVDAMVEAGAWGALVERHGEALVANIQDAFVQAMPAGEVTQRPMARFIVARRR